MTAAEEQMPVEQRRNRSSTGIGVQGSVVGSVPQTSSWRPSRRSAKFLISLEVEEESAQFRDSSGFKSLTKTEEYFEQTCKLLSYCWYIVDLAGTFKSHYDKCKGA